MTDIFHVAQALYAALQPYGKSVMLYLVFSFLAFMPLGLACETLGSRGHRRMQAVLTTVVVVNTALAAALLVAWQVLTMLYVFADVHLPRYIDWERTAYLVLLIIFVLWITLAGAKAANKAIKDRIGGLG